MKSRQAATPNTRSTAAPDPGPESRGLLWARSVGIGTVSLGAPVGIGIFHLALGAIIVGIELAVMLTIIGTALFGSHTLSERAFRLLRWIGNRPEPPSPPASHPTGGPLGNHAALPSLHRGGVAATFLIPMIFPASWRAPCGAAMH